MAELRDKLKHTLEDSEVKKLLDLVDILQASLIRLDMGDKELDVAASLSQGLALYLSS
ncbi:hypothetical protein AB1I63_00055 [Streptococcus pneumoniae]